MSTSTRSAAHDRLEQITLYVWAGVVGLAAMILTAAVVG